jgi:hypothetical protein
MLAWLLQRRIVRFHRIQHGFARCPAQYRSFVVDVVGPRVRALGPCRLGIFGTGQHTALLLQELPELQSTLACFADNSAAAGRTLHGRPVLLPRLAVAQCDAMVLSTAVFQEQMRADLRTLGFGGPVIAVDDVVPPEWFLLPDPS